MAKNRVVLTFSAAPGGTFTSLSGWSETFWRNVDETPDALLNLLLPPPGAPLTIPLISRRRDLLTGGWRIDGVRIYPLAGGRVVASATIPGNQGKGVFPIVTGQQEQQPYDRLLYRMNCTDGHSRSARLGGISSSVVDPGGNYVDGGTPLSEPGTGGDFHLRLVGAGGWFQTLIAGQFGMRFATVSEPFEIIDVVTATATIAGATPRTPVLTFTGDQTAIFTAGKSIRVTKATDPARLNGQWTIQSVDVASSVTRVKLRAKQGIEIAGDYHGGAYARSLTYGVAAMTSGSPVRGVSRKAGRPSGLPRGRRSKKR